MCRLCGHEDHGANFCKQSGTNGLPCKCGHDGHWTVPILLSDWVSAMSDEQVLEIWVALGKVECSPDDPYRGVFTMQDWTELVYSEKSKRGL